MSVRVKSEPLQVESMEESKAPPSISSSDRMELDEEEEEEVVREIDVFLSPELSNQLYLMQFPLQQQALSSPEAARVKPSHCMVELDYRTPSGIEECGNFAMSTRTYVSSTIPVSTHLALGKIVDKAGSKGLHLIPLSRISQMRPSFAHVDEATSNAMATSEDEVRLQERAEAAKLERKPLAFQKKESERAALARKSSYGYKKASEESELWNLLEVHCLRSPEADEALSKVACMSPDQNLLLDAKEDSQDRSLNSTYVQSLNYLPLGIRGQEKEEGDEEVASVCSKLVELMHQGLPIPYSLLRAQFPKPVSDQTLFVALGSCSFLVRGNFILQSRLMPLSAALAQARTFMLFLLQTMGVVHRSRLEYLYEGDKEVNPDVIFMLLEQVGKLTHEGWKLKVDDDETFADKYPSAVSVHLQFWGNQVRRFRPLLDRYGQQ